MTFASQPYDLLCVLWYTSTMKHMQPPWVYRTLKLALAMIARWPDPEVPQFWYDLRDRCEKVIQFHQEDKHSGHS